MNGDKKINHSIPEKEPDKIKLYPSVTNHRETLKKDFGVELNVGGRIASLEKTTDCAFALVALYVCGCVFGHPKFSEKTTSHS